MKDLNNTRGRAGDVRQSTRSYLRSLREERVRRRGGDLRAIAPQPKVAPTPEAAVRSSSGPAAQDIASVMQDDMALAALPSAPDRAPIAPNGADALHTTPPDPGPGATMEAVDVAPDILGSAAPEPDMSDAPKGDPEHGEAGPTHAPASGVAVAEGARNDDTLETLSAARSAVEQDPTVLERSELMALPGIGPGLVWMLNRSGVTTLQHMADADVTWLRSALGLVGDLLDLEYWRACARAQINAE